MARRKSVRPRPPQHHHQSLSHHDTDVKPHQELEEDGYENRVDQRPGHRHGFRPRSLLHVLSLARDVQVGKADLRQRLRYALLAVLHAINADGFGRRGEAVNGGGGGGGTR